MAANLGISLNTYKAYEQDKNNLPDDIKHILANQFGVNLHWLLTGTGSMLLTDTPAPDLPAEDAALLADIKHLVKTHGGTGECRECKELKQKIAELEERERKLIRENGNLEGKLELLQEQSIKSRGCSAG